MDYGDIITRAFRIMWRHKALWVLGLFAGISGCQASVNGNYQQQRADSASWQGSLNEFQSSPELRQIWSFVEKNAGLLIGIGIGLVFIWILWSLVSVAAKGGLVAATNAADEGLALSLGEAWSAGFARFGQLFLLHVVVRLPLFLLGMGLLVALIALIFGVGVSGSEEQAGGAAIGGLCGILAALPLLLVVSLLVDNLFLISLRYLVLGGQGAIEAVRNAWAFFRARFKDTALMYIIGGVLNLAAVFSFSIIATIIGAGAGISLGVAAALTEDLGAVVGSVIGIVAIVMVIYMAFTAVWGTFTNALWTVFFRRVTGMAVAAVPAYAAPVEPQWAPQPPVGYAPPVPPAPPAPPAAPQPPAPPAAPPDSGETRE